MRGGTSRPNAGRHGRSRKGGAPDWISVERAGLALERDRRGEDVFDELGNVASMPTGFDSPRITISRAGAKRPRSHPWRDRDGKRSRDAEPAGPARCISIAKNQLSLSDCCEYLGQTAPGCHGGGC